LYSLLVAIVIPFSLSWMSYNPLVQTFLARMAASYLSKRMNTVIKIDGLYISPRLTLNATAVLAMDQRGDTLFHAGELSVNMKRFRLQHSKRIFEVNAISIADASFSLIMDRHDSAFTYSFIGDHFKSDATDTGIDTIPGQTDWHVSLSELDLKNVRFRYIDENRDPKPVGMDYRNLDIFVYELQMEDLNILNDTFDFAINRLSCYDRCGFVVDELYGDFRLSPLFLIADSLHVVTPRSDVNLDLAFHYHGWPSYIRFTEEVEMLCEIRPSELNIRDIGYFAPDLLVMDNQVRIGGSVKGKVNNMKVKDFRFAFGKSTHFQGDVRLYGLPDVRETYIHTRIDEFTMSQADVKKFAIPGSYRHIPVPPELEVFGMMEIQGAFTGFYNDFVSKAEFISDIGTITTDISLRQNEDHTDVVYDGHITARNFDIGEFLHLSDYFGSMDLDARINGSGLTGKTAEIGMIGNIDSLDFMGNTFNQLELSGEIAENKFNGSLDVQDDLLNLAFNGILDFEKEKPLFDFTAVITDADLFKLNMIDRDSLLMLDVKLNCNFIGYELDDLEGRIRIDSLDYREGDKRWYMEHLAMISLKDTGYFRRIMLTSDILDADIKGNYTSRELVYAIDHIVSQEFPEWSFMPDPEVAIRNQKLSFEIEMKDTEALTDIFVPGLYVEENALIRGAFAYPERSIETEADFPFISYLGMRSDSMKLLVSADMDKVSLSIGTDRIMIKEGQTDDTLQLGLENFSTSCALDDDSLNFDLSWDDHSARIRNKANIQGYYTYIDSVKSELKLTTAELLLNDSLWLISPENRIVFGPRYFQFSELNFIGSSQQLNIGGTISDNYEDTLRVGFRNWRLSNFDIIFANNNFDLNGVTDGYFGLSNLYGTPNLIADLKISHLEFNDVLIGDADIQSHWDQDKKSVQLDSKIIYHGNVSDSKVVSLKGSYYPERESNNLDFLLDIDNFRMETMARFMDKYISGLRGIASGNFKIAGSISAPLLTGKLKLMRTECRVIYLNTKYSFAHSIDFNPGEIVIKDLEIYDTIGNTAVGNGKISHNKLKDFRFDLSVKPEEFICLQTNKYQNKVFYGTAIASGEVKFYGPLSNFHIDADVVTSKNSKIVIPLNNTFTATDNDFVIFLNKEATDEAAPAPDYKVDVRGLNLDFKIGITNTAETMIFLPENMGNISSKGFGDIRFTINPRGEFAIFGDYNFLRGTFFFTMEGLINKRFEILQGGKISFTGNPYNADVNLKAQYRLKTTLTGLGASISTEYEGQRVNVNAILGLRGKLANPDIHFSIGFPNVKDEVQQTIYAVLDTNDATLMNQQMISLLLMNNFSYANTSVNMGASSLNIISSQLSNWLSQISNDFDIGINYIPGDEITQDEVEVALSTQFFDNRLIVDGNVGMMTKDEEQQQASNIVGDVNIEYKLTPDGRIRLRAFNRSNNFNTIDYYAPYTQGVGIFYTKEFDRFSDIFKRQRKKKEKLEEDVE